MKRRKDNYDDSMYDLSVEEWENKLLPDRLLGKQVQWGMGIVPSTILVGMLFAGGDFTKWLVLGFVAYLCLMVFTFLEELNENLRFTRRQIMHQKDHFDQGERK